MSRKETWSNTGGQDFYKVIPKAVLAALYEKGGMLSCLNGEISTSFFALTHQEKILEVGAGAGRIINVLEKKGFREENITAVERDQYFANVLQQRFPKLKIYAGSIQDFQSNELFDYIGCWYSVFMEFNATEQKALLIKLRQLLKPITGMIIIDVVPPGAQSNATHATKQEVKIQLDGIPPIHFHGHTLDTLSALAKSIDLKMTTVTYWTDTGRKRVQCILVDTNNLMLVMQTKQLAEIKSGFFETRRAYQENKQNAENSEEMTAVLKPF